MSREAGEWALQSIQYGIYFRLSYRVGLRRKNARLYLNGIVIASLSAASGTRWILTACRFKICSKPPPPPPSHKNKPFYRRFNAKNFALYQTHTHTYLYVWYAELNDIRKMKLLKIDRHSLSLSLPQTLDMGIMRWLGYGIEIVVMAFTKWQSMNKIKLN